MNYPDQLPFNSAFDHYHFQPMPTPRPGLQLKTYHRSSISSCKSSAKSPDEGSDTDSIWDAYQPPPRQDRFIELCRTLECPETELSQLIREVYGDSAQAEYDDYLDDPDDFVHGLGLSATLEHVARATLRQLTAEAETEAQVTDHSVDFERIRALLEYSKLWRHCTKHCEDTMARNIGVIEGLLADIDNLLGHRRDALSRIASGTEEETEPDLGLGGEGEVTAVQGGRFASIHVVEETDDLRSATNIAQPGSSTSSKDEKSVVYELKGIWTDCHHSTASEPIQNHFLYQFDSTKMQMQEDERG